MGSNKKLSITIVLALVLIAVAIVFIYPRISVPDALNISEVAIEKVDVGAVVSYVDATGVVEAENEVLILSPARSIVKKVYKEPGSWIEKGELILELDGENVGNEIESISDQLEMKRNTLEKTRLNAQSTRLDLEYNEEVKKLRITSLKSTLADQQQLLEVGGISPAKLEQTKQEITLAEKDYQTLSEKNKIRLRQLEADEKGLQLQIRIQEKELEGKKELLKKLMIKAPSSGIILTVAGKEGERVDGDKMLVRMSDLSSFKLIGSVDEQYAKQIKTGNLVNVRIDGEDLEGRVGIITPVVENNKVQFNVHLKQKSHPKLIANQNVIIRVVNNKKDSVMRLKNCKEMLDAKRKFVYVVEGNVAVKKEVTLGIVGNDSCEILSGLKVGDEVIVDNLNTLRNIDEIAIQQ